MDLFLAHHFHFILSYKGNYSYRKQASLLAYHANCFYHTHFCNRHLTMLLKRKGVTPPVQLCPLGATTSATSDSLGINWSYTTQFLHKFFQLLQAYYVTIITQICGMESPI